ncbi:hypothetical protein C2S51_025718 [Perilla frutescens var. frutescens]|nr:hypothetical protein C2S51_025718 [Perilla frutescens var. frutescens]
MFRVKKEAEFHTLKQGKMSVTEYERVFCELSRYAPLQVDTDEKMASKFRSGLRHEIVMSLASREHLTYAESLNRALDIEAVMPEERKAPVSAPVPTSAPTPARTPSQSFQGKRKWNDGGNQNKNQGYRKPWQGNRQQGQQGAPAQGRTAPSQPNIPLCPRCNKSHQVMCQAGNTGCYNCGRRVTMQGIARRHNKDGTLSNLRPCRHQGNKASNPSNSSISSNSRGRCSKEIPGLMQ